MTITPFGIDFGPVTVTFFGLIVTAALAAGGYVAFRAVRQHNESVDTLLDVVTWGLLGGVIAGRLFYIWNPPPSVAAIYDRRWYLTHFFDLQVGPLAVWSGGLGPAGILIGALAGAAIVLRRRKADLRRWADMLTAGLLVALAILPWANVANQQMFGPPTTLPWGITLIRRVPPYDDLAAFSPATRFHPTPAYLALWALVALAAVWLVSRRAAVRLRVGDQLLLGAAVYLPGLFAADFLRTDVAHGLLGLTGLQAVAAILWVAVPGSRLVRWRATAPADRKDGPSSSTP